MLELSVQEGIDRVITFSNDGDPLDFQIKGTNVPATLQISQNHSRVFTADWWKGPSVLWP